MSATVQNAVLDERVSPHQHCRHQARVKLMCTPLTPLAVIVYQGGWNVYDIVIGRDLHASWAVLASIQVSVRISRERSYQIIWVSVDLVSHIGPVHITIQQLEHDKTVSWPVTRCQFLCIVCAPLAPPPCIKDDSHIKLNSSPFRLDPLTGIFKGQWGENGVGWLNLAEMNKWC